MNCGVFMTSALEGGVEQCRERRGRVKRQGVKKAHGVKHLTPLRRGVALPNRATFLMMLYALLAHAGAWTQQATRVLPDTIVTRQILVLGWFDQLVRVASGILVLGLLTFIILLFPAAWYLRRNTRQLIQLMEALRSQLAPLAHHTTSLVNSIDHIATTIRGDVDQLSGTVRSVDAQIRDAAKLGSERVKRFNDLLEAVQSEAEDLLVTTATVVRGARLGMGVLRRQSGNDGDALEPAAEDEPKPARVDDVEPRPRNPPRRNRRRPKK